MVWKYSSITIHPSQECLKTNKEQRLILVLFYKMVQVKLYTSLSLSSLTPDPSIGVELLAEAPLLLSRPFGAIQTSNGESVG